MRRQSREGRGSRFQAGDRSPASRSPILPDVPALLARLGISAKRKGREWWACCPFHAERTPSWQIRDDIDDPERHARWRCLGACHDGGSAIGLVMRILELERPRDAIVWLRDGAVHEPGAGQIGEWKPEQGIEIATHERATRVGFRLPAGVRFAPLEDWPPVAIAYLESRGVTEEQVDRWGLGYAVDGRLAKRVVLPWRSSAGELGGYTARAYVPGESRKHLEPTKDEGAKEGWIYGEELWAPISEREQLVLVEGAFDGFAVERAGFYFGAVRGSRLQPGHVARLSTWEIILVASDPDVAGDAFADEVIDTLGRHVRVRRVELPEGTDPAKLERRQGAAALAELLR